MINNVLNIFRLQNEHDGYIFSGFFSFRRGTGSWFMTSLCNVLQTCHKQIDLMSMLTRVNHQVAFEYESNTPGRSLDKRRTHRRRIVPWICSMLTKDLYFRPKTAQNERITFVQSILLKCDETGNPFIFTCIIRPSLQMFIVLGLNNPARDGRGLSLEFLACEKEFTQRDLIMSKKVSQKGL